MGARSTATTSATACSTRSFTGRLPAGDRETASPHEEVGHGDLGKGSHPVSLSAPEVQAGSARAESAGQATGGRYCTGRRSRPAPQRREDCFEGARPTVATERGSSSADRRRLLPPSPPPHIRGSSPRPENDQNQVGGSRDCLRRSQQEVQLVQVELNTFGPVGKRVVEKAVEDRGPAVADDDRRGGVGERRRAHPTSKGDRSVENTPQPGLASVTGFVMPAARIGSVTVKLVWFQRP